MLILMSGHRSRLMGKYQMPITYMRAWVCTVKPLYLRHLIGKVASSIHWPIPITFRQIYTSMEYVRTLACTPSTCRSNRPASPYTCYYSVLQVGCPGRIGNRQLVDVTMSTVCLYSRQLNVRRAIAHLLFPGPVDNSLAKHLHVHVWYGFVLLQ